MALQRRGKSPCWAAGVVHPHTELRPCPSHVRLSVWSGVRSALALLPSCPGTTMTALVPHFCHPLTALQLPRKSISPCPLLLVAKRIKPKFLNWGEKDPSSLRPQWSFFSPISHLPMSQSPKIASSKDMRALVCLCHTAGPLACHESLL